MYYLKFLKNEDVWLFVFEGRARHMHFNCLMVFKFFSQGVRDRCVVITRVTIIPTNSFLFALFKQFIHEIVRFF